MTELKEGDKVQVIGVIDEEGNIQAVEITEITEDDGSNSDFDGWFCIKTDPFQCRVCKVWVDFSTIDHKIIVWPEKDHPNCLKQAECCQKVGRNPKIIEYEKSFGPCISWYAFHEGQIYHS